MVVPHGSMRAWLAMDVDAMASKGIRGMVGVRHWRAEKESRGRTTLPRAGDYSGSGEPMLGKAEDAMMVFCADEARKGTPASEDSLPELLLGVSIKLGCINTYTSKLYDKSTDVRHLARGFIERCKKKGVPLKACTGKGLSVQRAE